MSMLNVGIIGCGNISTAYIELAPIFTSYRVVACADLKTELADAQAAEFGINAMSVDALLADPGIDVVINLTTPAAHMQVSTAILQSGKHVYSEKPFVLSVEDGRCLQNLAADQNLRIGSAPDTFLGGAHQAARMIIDNGDIGKIISGTCHVQSHGMMHWHPDPDFFFQPGGGPVLDMGPYYISNLVQLIGPVKRVVAMSSRPSDTRTIGCGEREDEAIAVHVDTTIHAILEFEQGAVVTLAASWDVRSDEHNHMELYGSEQTLYVPDPNRFGDVVRVSNGETAAEIPALDALGKANIQDDDDIWFANYRGAGLADMCAAIRDERPHRCNDELALHVIDVLVSILSSGEQGRFVNVETSCARPAALDNAAASLLLAGA